MSDQKENRNTWEGALGGLETPPLPASWKAMEGLLDREMPVRPRQRGWRWLWLLLLLLLIGVCNLYRGDRRSSPAISTKREAQGSAGRTEGNAGDVARFDGAAGSREAGTTGSAGQTDAGTTEPARAQSKGKTGRVATSGAGTGVEVQDAGGAAAKKDTVFTLQKTDSGKAKLDTTRTVAKLDTTHPGSKVDTTHPGSKITAKKEKRTEPPYRGLTAGIGLNQFFPVGPQASSNINSSGTNGTITDYLPVPQVRYFFSRKLYVEMEAQFNTPQYTSKNLLASQQVTPDSATGGQQSSSVYIKKLFYFNLPVSVHYSPVKGLYVGAGLEYAKLTNGVADFSQGARFSNSMGGFYDTVLTSKIVSFKGDSIYQKLRTHEWRLLGDVDYQWKGFTLGLRYNWALNKFINLQVSGTQVTQARNSSLQLYLRYTIWRQRSIRKSPK